jgi:hypothetical protein
MILSGMFASLANATITPSSKAKRAIASKPPVDLHGNRGLDGGRRAQDHQKTLAVFGADVPVSTPLGFDIHTEERLGCSCPVGLLR